MSVILEAPAAKRVVLTPNQKAVLLSIRGFEEGASHSAAYAGMLPRLKRLAVHGLFVKGLIDDTNWTTARGRAYVARQQVG